MRHPTTSNCRLVQAGFGGLLVIAISAGSGLGKEPKARGYALTGTPLENHGYEYFGERAYEKWIQP